MKKILFMQLKGNSYAGIWQVNKMIGESLINKGYDVRVLGLRNNKTNIKLEHDKRLIIDVINKKDIWEKNYTGREIISEIKKIHIIKAFNMLIVRMKHKNTICHDKRKIKNYLEEYNPDCIITSHYELIDMLPKKYLNILCHEQHSSFNAAIENNGTRKVFNKYKDKIKFIWLAKKTMEAAQEYGIKNNCYIYNPVRIISKTRADIEKNKKLVSMGRISKEKRIDLMIDIVNEVFKDKELKDWTFDIYGEGEDEEKIKSIIKNNRQITFKGLTNNPSKVLMSSSINLNTSTIEGFSMTVLEANECGVPTISFAFGESVYEQIIDNKTGYIAKDKGDYINKLKELMKNNKELDRMSKNVKKYNENFHIEKIIDNWVDLIENIGDK